MERQARKISTWGKNVFVKIPITNMSQKSSVDVVRHLVLEDIQLNITALMTPDQVRVISPVLGNHIPSFISIFAGRVADTGREPGPLMREAVEIMSQYPNQELIWASPRELLNIYHADEVGCHVITVTHDILKKLALLGKDLDEFSLDTVKMFHQDAKKAGFEL